MILSNNSKFNVNSKRILKNVYKHRKEVYIKGSYGKVFSVVNGRIGIFRSNSRSNCFFNSSIYLGYVSSTRGMFKGSAGSKNRDNTSSRPMDDIYINKCIESVYDTIEENNSEVDGHVKEYLETELKSDLQEYYAENYESSDDSSGDVEDLSEKLFNKFFDDPKNLEYSSDEVEERFQDFLAEQMEEQRKLKDKLEQDFKDRENNLLELL